MKHIVLFGLFCFIAGQSLFSQYGNSTANLLGNSIQTTIDSLEKAPVTPINLTHLGNLFSSIESYRKAEIYYQKALELDSTNLNRFKLAEISEKLKKYPKALNLYNEVWKKDSLNNLLQYRLAKLEMRLRNYKKAFDILNSLNARDTTHPVYPYQMGLIKTLDYEYSKAIDFFLESYKRDSLNIDAIYQLTNAFNKLKIEDSTALFMKRGLKLVPEHENLNRIKINRLSKEKKYEEAITLLLKQDSLYPNEFFNTKMLGICYFKIEAYDKAVPWFKRATQNNPEDYTSSTYLGHIALKKGKLEEALINYMRGTKIAKIPRDEEYIGLGNVFIEKGNLKIAMEMFEKAVEENASNDDALFEWALASDRYYKDKTIGYKRYQRYLNRFSYKKDSVKLAFIKSRMGAIKEKLFLEGEKLDGDY